MYKADGGKLRDLTVIYGSVLVDFSANFSKFLKKLTIWTMTCVVCT